MRSRRRVTRTPASHVEPDRHQEVEEAAAVGGLDGDHVAEREDLGMAREREVGQHRQATGRIDIDAGETRDVNAKLDAILGLIDELQSIDTSGVMPMSHAQDVMLALRDDVVTEADRHELFQQQAPAVAGGLYLVPKVIE